jgi:SdiA-regulated
MNFLNFAARGGIITILLLNLILAGCKRPQPKVMKSPPHYNFSQVLTAKLDLRLQEISGLAWDNQRDEFLAHFDEKGILFVLDKETKQIKEEYPFGAKGDYEDIAIYKGVPYVLISNGTIIRINRDSTGKVTGGEKMGQVGITGTNDFETMYADTARKALVIICKNCTADDKKTVSAYAFYPDSTGFNNTPVFQIDAAKVAEMSPHKTSKLQPSAAAIHPVLKKLFIISSAANLFVVADLNGNVEGVYELGKKLFPQPEGLTFKSNGDMYISNEGVNTKSTIHRFVYKP